MNIIIDAMGGDNAPKEILIGAAQAVSEYKINITAVGNEDIIRKCAKDNNISLENIEIVNASEVIEMCDEPVKSIRSKKDSSLVVALNLLKEGKGDALVSAGSTGALHVGTSLIVKTIKGVKRPALGSVIPGANGPFLLMDCGANVECRAEMLVNFAVMGSVYMEKVMGIKNPKVGLVNNGTEESKGTPLYVEAHQLLKVKENINFTGNIEPKEVPQGDVHVVVCDGFTGNVVLKLTEGVAKYLVNELKVVFKKNLISKIAYLMIKDGMKDFKKKMDSEEQGGAPILGAAKPVIKAHGSSHAKGVKNAIRQAISCVENNMVSTMKESMEQV